MTLKELYDKIESYPSDTMNFCIEDVFSWRGIYAEPCCSLSTKQTTKQENLNMLRRLTNEVFRGYKGGEYTYTFDDWINFECDCSEYTDGRYLNGFINKYKENPEVKHIFG